MKRWISLLCLGLFLISPLSESEAGRIVGGKPMAPRNSGLDYDSLQSHVRQSRPTYQSNSYYERQYYEEITKGRQAKSLTDTQVGAPPVQPLNYGSLRRSVLDAAKNPPPDEYNPFKVKREYGTNPSSRPKPRYPTEGSKTPRKLF
jgi:hypothetical protein